jgi:hypothetical protein
VEDGTLGSGEFSPVLRSTNWLKVKKNTNDLCKAKVLFFQQGSIKYKTGGFTVEKGIKMHRLK